MSVVEGGTTPAFTAVTKDAGGHVVTGRTITFNSSNPAVATISSTSGVATGVDPGTALITASSEGKTSTAATLTVTEVPVNSVVVTPPSQSVDIGSTVNFVASPRDASNNPLSGRTIVYSSSDPTIATINSSTGVATGVASGSVTIGAISEGKTGTASLTVNPIPVASLDISPTLVTGTNAGGTIQFTATPRDASSNALTGRVITWTSSSPGTATIDADGLMTAITDGIVTITAHCEGVDSLPVVVTILL